MSTPPQLEKIKRSAEISQPEPFAAIANSEGGLRLEAGLAAPSRVEGCPPRDNAIVATSPDESVPFSTAQWVFHSL